jgi:hypothetical protein
MQYQILTTFAFICCQSAKLQHFHGSFFHLKKFCHVAMAKFKQFLIEDYLRNRLQGANKEIKETGPELDFWEVS